MKAYAYFLSFLKDFDYEDEYNRLIEFGITEDADHTIDDLNNEQNKSEEK